MQEHTPVLVTGGAGYIGAHVCKALATAGFLPITYDNLSTGHAYAVKWGPLVEGDLGDGPKLCQTLATYQPKAVLHFAASALVAESMEDPGKYYRNNVVNGVTLLEAMRAHGISRLIFSSTCATYGDPQFTPITEDHPQVPISPYGRSKLMVEQMLADFEKAFKIRSVMLRYFNVAGADLTTEIGENHTPETHLIPSVIQTALGLREEICVYGTDFPSRDGSAIRDYLHVQDLALAHVAALQWLFLHEKSVAVNLGTGTGYSVLQIIDAVQKFCNKTIPTCLKQRRAGDPAILTADHKRALELFGWTPRLSDLPTLIESAWKWHVLLMENTPLLRSTLTRLGTYLSNQGSSIFGMILAAFSFFFGG